MIAHQFRSGNGEHYAVNGALWPVPHQVPQQSFPVALVRGGMVGAQEEVPGHVQNHSRIEEPPLNAFCHAKIRSSFAQREADSGMVQQRSLARTTGAHNQKPWGAIAAAQSGRVFFQKTKGGTNGRSSLRFRDSVRRRGRFFLGLLWDRSLLWRGFSGSNVLLIFGSPENQQNQGKEQNNEDRNADQQDTWRQIREPRQLHFCSP